MRAILPALLVPLTLVADQIPIVCSLDRPVVSPQQSVRATVLADSADPKSLRYRWTASGGGFITKHSGPHIDAMPEADSSRVEWNPGKSPSGTYKLVANVRDKNGRSASCSLDVVVAREERSAQAEAPTPSPVRDIKAELLLKNRAERKGYGLYSYLLLGRPPDGADTERFRKFIETYINEIWKVKQHESYLDSSELNATYLPVNALPADPDKLSADWVLENYDYSRAQFLLSGLPANHTAGPFIVSSLHPLPGRGPITGHYLFEDLSTVPVSALPFWVQQFMRQTSQQKFWDTKTVDAVALRLRTAIAIAAAGLPDVRNAVASWIVIGH